MIRVDSLHDLVLAGIGRVYLACGVFDGVHRGHRQIIESLIESAKRYDAHPVVFTFNPNPLEILAPHAAPDRLMSLDHRIVLLQDLGVDAVVVQNFCMDFAQLEPRQFITDVVLGSGIDLCGITVGQRWRFGYKGKGDCAKLEAFGEEFDFEVTPVSELDVDNGTVSSTRIRELVKNGGIKQAEELLGRPFSIYGEVRHGKGIATHELHYPTANVKPANEVLPPCGIYAANGVLRDGEKRITHPGILYLGNSPTYVDDAPAIPFLEIHLFDFDSDVYGKCLEIEFLEFIRKDEKFPDSSSLRAQIGRDIEVSRTIHASRSD